MDRLAQKILFDTYWSANGWKDRRSITEEDFQYAKSKGLMFDDILISHDQTVDWLLEVLAKTDKKKVTDAFLASLSTRQLALRSALGSYALARTFPNHTLLPFGNTHVPHCRICGETDNSQTLTDLNVLNFIRINWGGSVHHTDSLYAAFDLSQLNSAEVPQPTEVDFALFNQILAVIASCGPNDKPNQLEKKLSGVFKSNQNERRTIIELLGISGILHPKGRSSYFYQFVPKQERVNRTDWVYPVEWWRGADGVNEDALHFYFAAYPEIKVSSR